MAGGLLVAAALAAAKIAVLDVRTGAGVDPAMGGFLAQVIAKEVADRSGASPLVSSDITAMLGFERKKQMLGCNEEDSECLAEITGALGVDQVLASSVSLANGRYLVTLSLLDSRRARALTRSAQSAPHDEDQLLHAVRRAAWEIFGGTEPPRPAAPPEPAMSVRRKWAIAAGAAAVALAAGGAVAGANALSAARDGNSAVAKPRAHLADILFVVALGAGAAGTYLWLSGGAAGVGASW